MKSLFLDSSALIAIGSEKDRHHGEAIELLREQSSRGRLITSDFVLDETVSFLSGKINTQNAVSFVRGIMASRMYNVYYVDTAILATSLDFMSKYADKKISCTDATTMAFVRTQRISKIFTFDSDFRKTGFSVIP